MLLETTIILPIILAGLMNGSFVIPAKYIKSLDHEKIWLCHSIIGLILIPWVLLAFFSPIAFKNYSYLPLNVFFFIIASGIVFGLGQVWFSSAIKMVGIALSFAVNLGIGLIIGSMFVVVYKGLFLTKQGLLVTLAVFFILCSLFIYYHAGKIKQLDNVTYQHKLNYTKGWVLASLTGITSGLQNITFVLVAFHAKTQFQTDNSFWVWPPFLFAAAIPMIVSFVSKIQQKGLSSSTDGFLSIKNLILIILMGLCFTGSLALYSKGMSLMNHQQQILGWPVFMVSIILASQIWGSIYKEANSTNLRAKLYRVFSLILLITAIVILASQA